MAAGARAAALRWDYRQELLPADGGWREAMLALGDEGWECVAAHYEPARFDGVWQGHERVVEPARWRCVFKRPRPDS